MATSGGFWRGVAQNALGSILAGLVLLGLGKVWAEHHLGGLVDELRNGFGQVSAMQAQVDRLNQALAAMTAQAAPKEPKRHGKKH